MTLFILFACLNQPQFPYLEWGDTYPPPPPKGPPLWLLTLTKREELLFLMVLAFPKASSTGFAWMI